MLDDLNKIKRLQHRIEMEPSVPIKRAACILKVSVKTVYRQLLKFELVRKHGRREITQRSLRRFIENDFYQSNEYFDLIQSDED